MGFEDVVASTARKYSTLSDFVLRVAQKVAPDRCILLPYPIDSKPRWSVEKPNPALAEIINRDRSTYAHHLRSFLRFRDNLLEIPERPPKAASSRDPYWLNGWMPALDGIALYSFISLNRPKRYLEIGSGNSTKFARRAIVDHSLDTRIISVDPCPRADVEDICDESIRSRVEDVPLETFDILEANDILYIDNSHTVFMNSDSTVMFLDVIPRLKPGVLVEIHDIALPCDYPVAWKNRYYAEQYLLAAYLLADGNRFDIALPSAFVSDDAEMKEILSPLWAAPAMKNVEKFGCSFWFRMRGVGARGCQPE